jgi:hypothetical protein
MEASECVLSRHVREPDRMCEVLVLSTDFREKWPYIGEDGDGLKANTSAEGR